MKIVLALSFQRGRDILLDVPNSRLGPSLSIVSVLLLIGYLRGNGVMVDSTFLESCPI